MSAPSGSSGVAPGTSGGVATFGGISTSATGSNGVGSRKQYFYLSDLAKPVQLKVRGVTGNLADLAERMLFEQGLACETCGGTVTPGTPLHTDMELYVSVSIWSRGAPIGLPAHTPYRAAQPLDSAAAAAAAAASSLSPSASSASMSSGGGGSSVLSSSASGGGSSASLSGVDLASGVLAQQRAVRWNSWLQFPVQYKDLDHASRFGITVWCVAHGTGVSTGGSAEGVGATTNASAGGATSRACSCHHTSPSKLTVHSRLFAVGGCSVPIFNKRG